MSKNVKKVGIVINISNCVLQWCSYANLGKKCFLFPTLLCHKDDKLFRPMMFYDLSNALFHYESHENLSLFY